MLGKYGNIIKEILTKYYYIFVKIQKWPEYVAKTKLYKENLFSLNTNNKFIYIFYFNTLITQTFNG